MDYVLRKWQPVYVTVGEERHEDGGKHFHVFFKSNKRIRSTSERYFDWEGCHPNIQSAYNPHKCKDYCQKDGNYVEHGDAPEMKEKKRGWEDLITAPTKEEFFKQVAEVYPRDYVINLEKIEYYADKKYKAEMPPYEPRFGEFVVPERVQEWIAQMENVCALGATAPRNPSPPNPPQAGGR